jgi:uncharacterized SAM-binding protein YcdF (DUF218 family)
VGSIEAQLDSEAYSLGEVLWEYLRVRHTKPAYTSACPGDVLIMVLGSPDLGVADHAAELLRQEVAEQAVVSGGCSLPCGSPSRVEADIIADLIVAQGIAEARLIRELSSTNTSEHFWRTQELLAGRPDVAGGENPPKFVALVPTPVAERRALATARRRWSDTQFWIDGIQETYQSYMERTDYRDALSRMIGEVERILAYPILGYMTPPDEPVTKEVQAAYAYLKRDFNDRPVRGMDRKMLVSSGLARS